MKEKELLYEKKMREYRGKENIEKMRIYSKEKENIYCVEFSRNTV